MVGRQKAANGHREYTNTNNKTMSKLLIGFALSLILSLASAAAPNVKRGDYIPIGHGRCHDASFSEYQSLHLVKLLHDDPDFQSFYEAPREIEGLEHLNSVSDCEKQCKSLESNTMYRGYEIVIGRGCYCLMDYDVMETKIGGAMIGEGKGTGSVTGSDDAAGFYCYAFRKYSDDVVEHDESGSGPAPPTNTVTAQPEIKYESVHLLVGKGMCHDTQGRRYPSILHYTDGSNHKCKQFCNLVTPMKAYRGYETYPKDKMCACLFDTSSSLKNGKRYIDGGTGGEGNIRGVVPTTGEWKEAFCYKYYKTVKKTRIPNGKWSIRSVQRGDEMEDSHELSPSNWKHISMGKGLCVDSKSRPYIGIQHIQPEDSFPISFDCAVLCSQHRSNPLYRGFEAVHTNLACKCLFDAEAKYDEELANSLKGVGEEGGEGEIKGIHGPNPIQECFKYVVDYEENPDKYGSVAHSDDSSPLPSRHSYELVGEGICVDAFGLWFDAVEFRDVIATDCEKKCSIFTEHPNFRGIEVTLGKVCFCLFDDGTQLANVNVLNYGKGKGEVAGVSKKEGAAGPFCFKYTTVSDTGASLTDDIHDEDDTIMMERRLHEKEGRNTGSPASQPSSGQDESTQDNTVFESLTEPPPHTYNSIFVPHQTQYDFLRFDPYSFSGAPLGGWGRDTRNRLASLPLRLVHGFEGNWNEVAKRTSAADVGATASEMEIGPDGSQVPKNSKIQSNNEAMSSTSKQSDQPTRPPHFIIHDGTGQKFICRVYCDNELVVTSRMDSMFLPATTVEENGGSPVTYDEKESHQTDVKTGNANAFNMKIKGGGKWKISFGGNTFSSEDENSLREAISSAVTNTLNVMGIGDAFEGFGEQNANGGAEDINAMLTQIGMAAAVGAGVEGAAQVASSAGIISQDTIARKLSVREILEILDTFKEVCSQAHLGWWSYEWCHQQKVIQFHVGVSGRGGGAGNQVLYEVQDVTLVGHFNGHMEIIYPSGNYADENDKKGTIMTITSDSKGEIVDSDIRALSKDEDELWRRSHHDNIVVREYHKDKGFDNRGPIIKQTFDHGDMCDEIGYPRQMTVEMRCCRETELLQFMKSKIHDSSKKAAFSKESLPKAALVGVAESKTAICHYTSHVCVPALCPDKRKVAALIQPEVTVNAGEFDNQAIQHAVMNAFDTASESIATKLAEMFGENLDVDDVQVYFGEEANVGALEELLINENMEPSQVKGLLNTFFSKKQVVKPPALQIKEGESVRELLDRALGKKPWYVVFALPLVLIASANNMFTF
jgi:hypothetical protein